MTPDVWERLWPLSSHAPADVLTEASVIVLLLVAALVVYRAFQERYLIGWIAGWGAYLAFRLAIKYAVLHPDVRGWAALAEATFGVAAAGFVASVLLYTDFSRLLVPLGIATAIGVDLALMHAFWWPRSAVMTTLVLLVWIAICALGAVRLGEFFMGRRKLAPWLLAVTLALFPGVSPNAPAFVPRLGLWVETLLGLSMLLLLLDAAQARLRRLRVVNALSDEMAQSRDDSTLLSTALKELSTLLESDAAWFRLLQGDRLVLTSHVGLSDEYIRSRGVLGNDSFTASVLRSGTPRMVRRRDADTLTLRRLMDDGFDHVLIVPVAGKAGPVGSLSIASRNHRSYSLDEIQFVASTARHLGLAVENLRMLDRVLHSQRQWVNTFDSIADAILVHDDQLNVIRANRALGMLVNQSPSEIYGRKLLDVLPASTATVANNCPYCLRQAYSIDISYLESPDPCFGGYSVVSTFSYSEDGTNRLGTIHIVRDTTERRLAEQRYKLLFDGVHEGAFISTPEGKLIDCNEALVRMLGYEAREEVLTLDIAGVLYADPKRRQDFLTAIERDGFVRNFEVRLRRKDGSEVIALESSFATRDSAGAVDRYQGFLLDVTDKKRTEDELRRRNHELNVLNALAVLATQSFDLDEILNLTLRQVGNLFSAHGASICLLDPATSMLSRRAAFGSSAQTAEMNNVRISEALLEKIRSQHLEVLSSEMLGEMPQEVQAFVFAEEIKSWLIIVLWNKDTIAGTFGLSSRQPNVFSSDRDRELLLAIGRQLATTIEKVRLYEETCRAYEHLSQTQEQLLQSEKMSAVGQLISGVAHELNNPLTAILGYAQLLETESQTDRARDFTNKIFRQAQRTHRVVQNLLSFARQRKPEKEQVDVRRVMDDALTLRDYDLKLNNIVVEREFSQSVAPVVADAHQLEQVFLNIINNAADAMLEAGRAGRLRVRVASEGGKVAIEIHDNGPGLKDTKRIFDPFYTTKQVGKGTGLGLSICYGIVKEHGGEITAFNHPQGGAVFRVLLPAAQEAATGMRESPAGRAQHGILHGRVLIVDDEESVLEFEREVLAGAGAEVTALGRGEDALRLLQRESFDAIVVDGKMPGKCGGFEIYKWISSHRPELEGLVVLTLSDISDPELRTLVETKQVAYLIKPFEVAELIAAIRRVLERRAAGARV
jgi:PAS domain S-box-containing protein